jgi:hypothetical protein
VRHLQKTYVIFGNDLIKQALEIKKRD